MQVDITGGIKWYDQRGQGAEVQSPHRKKGQQFPTCQVLNIERKCFPQCNLWSQGIR